MNGKTIKERRILASELAKKFILWGTMNDAELLNEAQKIFTVVTSASRDSCYQILVTDHVEKMIG